MKKLGFASLSTVLCLAFALPVPAQQPSAAELACNAKYGKFYAETQKTLTTFDDFVKDATCKDSMYREGAFQIMMQQLVMASKWKDAMDLGNRYISEFPNAKEKEKMYIFSNALTAAGRTGDMDKVLEWGEKVLTVDANDLNSSVILIAAIPDKFTQPQIDAALKEKLMARGVELAKRLLAATRNPAIDEKTWQTAVIAPAHSLIGFVHLQKKENAEAAEEYAQTVKINPKDQASWYRYGLATTYITTAAQGLIKPAYDAANDLRNTPGPEYDEAVAKRDAVQKDYVEKRDKAIDVFISAVALGGPIADSARKTLESMWVPSHNDSKDGLEEAIAMRKAELTK